MISGELEDCDVFLSYARVVRQPADNSCLYHALSYCLAAEDLLENVEFRSSINTYIRDKGNVEINLAPDVRATITEAVHQVRFPQVNCKNFEASLWMNFSCPTVHRSSPSGNWKTVSWLVLLALRQLILIIINYHGSLKIVFLILKSGDTNVRCLQMLLAFFPHTVSTLRKPVGSVMKMLMTSFNTVTPSLDMYSTS